MLVVPNHWGDAPIVPGSPFAGAAAALGGAWHGDLPARLFPPRRRAIRSVGRSHRGRLLTAREGEFLGLSRDEARRRIGEGRSLLEDVTGRPIDGFVARRGFTARVRWRRFPNAAPRSRRTTSASGRPATGERLASRPGDHLGEPDTSRAAASSLFAAAALRHAPLEALRVGVHPPDCRHPAIVRSIVKTLEAATQRAGARPLRRPANGSPARLPIFERGIGLERLGEIIALARRAAERRQSRREFDGLDPLGGR